MRSIAPAAAACAALCCAASVTGAAVAADPTRAATTTHQAEPLSPALKARLFETVAQKIVSRSSRSRSGPRGFTVATVTIPAGPRRVAVRNAGMSVTEVAAEQKKCDAGDPSVPPHMDRLKGKIGSGGYLVIDGECLGDSGAVELVGDFPGGRLALQNQSWSHTSITAGIPSVSGVYDQTVRIRVVRGNVVSNEVSARFVPEMEERVAPPSMIVNLTCAFDPGGCKDGRASHFSKTDAFADTASNGAGRTLSGDDRWELKPPRGWAVTSLDWVTNIGVAKIGDDFDTSPATDVVFTVHWENNYVSTSPGFLGVGIKDRYYMAVYSMTAHVAGPKGTWQ